MTYDNVWFLSDYGLEDEFVGVCQGVILRIAPHVKIIHIHHNILRQSIRHGAIVLEQSIRFMPESVHLAVVDPSVGSERRAIAIESGWGEIFVGPDNGLLMPAAERLGAPMILVNNAAHSVNDDYQTLDAASNARAKRSGTVRPVKPIQVMSAKTAPGASSLAQRSISRISSGRISRCFVADG